MPPLTIPNEPFRDAALRRIAAGEDWSLMCARIGYTRPDGGYETTRLKRQLGLLPESDSGKYRRRVTYDVAVRLVDAVAGDYTEFGV